MRRRLVRPDVAASGRGNNALFGWRSLLAIRILGVLHLQLGGTVSHWGPLMEQFRLSLERRSFLSLHTHAFVSDGKAVDLVPVTTATTESNPSIVIPLADHLAIVAEALGQKDTNQQLPLVFPVVVNQ